MHKREGETAIKKWKRLFYAAFLFACGLLVHPALACAEESYEDWDDRYDQEQDYGRYGDIEFWTMQVVNCSEWVSLRELPDVNSVCLETVPLGAIVTNCYYYSDEFTAVEYNGQFGYILSQYLFYIEPALQEYAIWDVKADIHEFLIDYEDNISSGETILDEILDDRRIIASRSFWYNESAEEEVLYIGCYDEQLEPVWGYMTYVNYISELDATDAFMTGTAQNPLTAIYNSEIGLMLIEPLSGEQIQEVSTSLMGLGGGLLHATDEDGTMYLTGYYAYDLAAVSMDGELLWTIDPDNPEVYWPYEIYLDGEDVVVNYASGTDTGHFVVGYLKNGARDWMDIVNF